MASIITQGDRRMIQFVASDGSRKTLRLGKCSLRQAETVKLKVEDLLGATITGACPSRETSQWLTTIDDVLREKLAAVGLIKGRARSLLKPFIEDFVLSRTDVKPSTQIVYARVKRYMLEYFAPDKPLKDITAGDADLWRLHLRNSGLAENTTRRTIGVAKQWFRSAMRQQLIDANPFGDFDVALKTNAERYHFIKLEDAYRVLGACPDAEWRLLFALARFGGLRVPSEVLKLRWGDINWEQGWFKVHSPKTEHFEGKESRLVPIFPELLPYLREAFEQAPEGTEYCITRYRDASVNLRTHLERIIEKAGLKAWPKLWQNLRSTRETELTDHHPAHVVCAWIGNSVPVAMKHYLQVTDEHFKRALQNPKQQAHAPACTDLQPAQAHTQNGADIASVQNNATPCSAEGCDGMGQRGLEPPTSPLSGARSSQLSY
jgi:integrase